MIEPGAQRERDAVDGRHGLVDFDQALDGYGRRRGHARADVAAQARGGGQEANARHAVRDIWKERAEDGTRRPPERAGRFAGLRTMSAIKLAQAERIIDAIIERGAALDAGR